MGLNNGDAERLRRSIITLGKVIELQHGGKATHMNSVHIKGIDIHIYTMTYHPTVRKAYAWSVKIDGNRGDRYFAVLHQNNIFSPLMAVKAASKLIKENLND